MPKCIENNKKGKPCGRRPLKGETRCWSHSVKSAPAAPPLSPSYPGPGLVRQERLIRATQRLLEVAQDFAELKATTLVKEALLLARHALSLATWRDMPEPGGG